MEIKTLNEKLQDAIKNLEKGKEQEKNLRNIYQEQSNNLRHKYWELEKNLNEKKRIEENEIDKEESEKLEALKISLEPFLDIKESISNKFKYYSIKNNLNEFEIKIDRGYNYNRHIEPEIIKTDNQKLIIISSFVSENSKPTNKFDLIIQITFKNYLLEEYFKNIKNFNWNKHLLNKSFKTKEECISFLNRNYNKITSGIIEQNNSLYSEIIKVEIDMNKEFDFMTIKYSACNRTFTPKSKNKAIFITEKSNYFPNKPREDYIIQTNITYLKDNKFKIDNEDNLEEIKSLLRNSHFGIEPEIILN